MKKKRRLLVVSLLVSVFLITLLSAGTVSEDGYECLKDEINENGCEDLSLDEKIFSVLATGECEDNLLGEALENGSCWGSNSCDIKQTSQAILALKQNNLDVNSSLEWLLSKKMPSYDVDWYLQVNAPRGTVCNLSDPNTNGVLKFKILENSTLEKISSSHPWFLIEDDYKIRIKQDGYGKDFNIYCDSDFSTSFLFKSDSSLHVSDITNSGSAGEEVKLKINSFCFSKTVNCNYQYNLWASLALQVNERETSSYLPYLIALSEDNEVFIPESFLYYLTGDDDYSSKLISKQDNEGYWDESNHKFYDTSIALFPFTNEEFNTKQNATNWLKEQQGNDGCWDDKDIVNTAFILFSVWPETSSEEGEEIVTCESQGGYCMSSSQCENSEGNELSEFDCTGFNVCCSKEELETTCNDVGGTICESGEECTGHIDVNVVESNCCVDGECQESQGNNEETSDCEYNLFECRDSCLDDETETDYACLDSESVCCKPKEKSYTWLFIILIVLIITLLVFVFRKKIMGFFKKSGSSEGDPAPSQPKKPRPPRRRPPAPQRRNIRRPPIKRNTSEPQPKPSSKKSKSEEEDVLKRLREMSE